MSDSEEETGPGVDALPDWYLPAVAATDAQTAFAIGLHHLAESERGGKWWDFERHIVFADAWFHHAFCLDQSLAWQAAVVLADSERGNEAGRCMKAGIWADHPYGSTIRVSEDCFRVFWSDEVSLTLQDWAVQVVTEEVAAATAVLEAALPRLVSVETAGHVFLTAEEEDEAYWVAEKAGTACYTPNWGGVRADPRGPVVSFDTKGGVYPLMARTMLRIMVEELTAAGLTTATIAHPDKVS